MLYLSAQLAFGHRRIRPRKLCIPIKGSLCRGCIELLMSDAIREPPGDPLPLGELTLKRGDPCADDRFEDSGSDNELLEGLLFFAGFSWFRIIVISRFLSRLCRVQILRRVETH
jgi:hypothetical protein